MMELEVMLQKSQNLGYDCLVRRLESSEGDFVPCIRPLVDVE